MHEPSEILKRIKYRSGETLAPITYQETVQLFQRAEDFIKSNPSNRIGIEQIGKEALFAAKRALYITDQVSALIQKMNFSLEQVILDEEFRLYRISRQFSNTDLRDNSLEKQSEQLAILAKAQAEEYQHKEDLIISLRETLIEVRDSSPQRTELANTHIELTKTQKKLQTQKALFDAELIALTKNLTASQTQLNNTQQTLLIMKQENTQLRQNTSTPVAALNSAFKSIEKKGTDPEPSTSQSAPTQQDIVENDDSIIDDFFANFDD